MADKLHILNGDSTLHLFQQSGIAGDTFVWNEILCEGPVKFEVGDPEFWKIRQAYLTDVFGPGASNYKQLIEEFSILENYEAYDEIILWYEYDLFCQVNLMAILSYLNREGLIHKLNISYICVGEEEGFDRLVGLGQIPVHRYQTHYNNRTALSEADLDFATNVWKSFCSDDPNELDFTLLPHPTFTYLSGSIMAHFKRFPKKSTGLSSIEDQILSYVEENSPGGPDDIVRNCLQNQGYYGFGDMQYFHYIKVMESLLSFQDSITLSDLGKSYLKGEVKRDAIDSMDYPLGGTTASSYYRDNSDTVLVK